MSKKEGKYFRINPEVMEKAAKRADQRAVTFNHYIQVLMEEDIEASGKPGQRKVETEITKVEKALETVRTALGGLRAALRERDR